MEIVNAGPEHIHFAKTISQTIEESAKDRGTGIARTNPSLYHGKDAKQAMQPLPLKEMSSLASAISKYGDTANMSPTLD